MRMVGAAGIVAGALLAAGLTAPTGARAQVDGPPGGRGGPEAGRAESIESINADYESDLAGIERKRLDRLARLAAGQGKDEAEKTYEVYFRVAIASGLFREAEPTAEKVLRSVNPSSRVASLAAIVNIVAEVDRGAYQESVDSLANAVEDQGGRAGLTLPRATRLSLAEAYYQRLVRADQFELARKAFGLIREKAEDPTIRDFAAGRLRRLDRVGKPAPPIEGTDLDGKPVSLAAYKGDVILVVFWATWHVPMAEEVAWLDRVNEAHRGRGFRILGVNVDTAQEGGERVETVLPNIRHFLLDYNVRWPNLINGAGDHDYARAYDVSEIPANYLIGRDGTIVHLDLTRANIERAVAKAVGN